jgi:D-sedoheptulose 7-phosphate isomerase
MQRIIENYYSNLAALLNSIKVADKRGNELGFYHGIEKVCDLIMKQAGKGNKMIFIGNGGSAAISSHMAPDFFKNGGMKTVAFNDGSMLTCLGNDYGYEYVFRKTD